jgi:hypothetical protein
MTCDSIEAYRQRYRAEDIPRGYRPWLHLTFTFAGGTLALAACLWQLEAVRPIEWLTVPLAFLYANLAEYLGHRFPMHRRFPGMGMIYKRHAGQHHRFFTHEHMAFGERIDVRAVLFPPILVIFFFGGFGLPVWLLLDWAISANVAWLFIATGVAYFLNYEILHFAYHLPPDSLLGRRALIRRLRWLHTLHHNPGCMARINFNISYPVFDLLFGTLQRGDARGRSRISD